MPFLAEIIAVFTLYVVADVKSTGIAPAPFFSGGMTLALLVLAGHWVPGFEC
jgi:hypothetical protein